MIFERVLEAVAKPSTVQLYREAKKRDDYSFAEFFHGWFYLKYPYFYIGVGKGEHPFSRTLFEPLCWLAEKLGLWREGNFTKAKGTGGFADTYHGKVVRTESARKLISVNREIALTNLEQVLPYTTAKDIILKNPDHIVLFDCPCRSVKETPCLPIDVCMIVGEPFVAFVEEHHPSKSRRVSPEEAIRVVEEENARGHVTHAFFKEAMLGRYYAICNCCACCCGAMRAHFNGTPMLESSGYLACINDQCVGCGLCVNKCQFSAISLQDRMAVIDAEKCMGCGVCRFQCKKDAITLERNEKLSEPLEIDALLPEYNAN